MILILKLVANSRQVTQGKIIRCFAAKEQQDTLQNFLFPSILY